MFVKVFVSSTTKDLGEARKKVCERLLQLDIQPVSMDWYTADGRPPKQVDETKVKQCDAFVIIVGHLYGQSSSGEKRSFTELEYETAAASGKTVYAFLASNKLLLSPDLLEDDARREKLRTFRERLEQDHTPRYFNNEDQLCTEVVVALAILAKGMRKLLVPLPPIVYIAHPYSLQENFAGRRKERAMLTEWVRGVDSCPMLSLVGMGGLGKSALTWYWLHEDLLKENLGFSGVIWWSFYEHDATFEAFLRHAVFYTSARTIKPQRVPSDYDRMQSLWCILRDSPFLLIFDGAERLLRAYHPLNAEYKGDDFRKEESDKHLLCADPRAGQFLQWLTSHGTKTRTLMTTRLHPKELDGLAGCRKENLQRLEPDDAVEFMRKQGIKGPRTAIIHACEPYDFLPLCLRLLSGAIHKAAKKRGDIDAAKGWHPPKDLVRREHHILQLAYDTMAKDRQELLSRVAAIRGPVDYETLNVLSTYENEDELNEALRELVARGLLFHQEGRTRYDLHPIVRQYAYDRLSDKTATHKTLKDYFDTVPRPEKIENLEDLMPAIELFHHTVAAGGYEEAFRVYKDQLTRPLYHQLGTYDTCISFCQAFFPDGENKPPRLKNESAQAWVVNSLGVAYKWTGQSRKAVGLYEQAVDMAEKHAQKSDVARVVGNLAESEMVLGKLKNAEGNLRRSVAIAQQIKDEFLEAHAHQVLGLLLARVGRYDKSEKELETADATWRQRGLNAGTCVVCLYYAVRALLSGNPQSALRTLQRGYEFWRLNARETYPIEWSLVHILWLSGAAKRPLSDLAGAEADLNDALSRCRRIRLVELEPDILLELAKLQWQKAKDGGLIEQAKSLTCEALEIADRCEYRLQQADVHNFLAEMAFTEGDKDAAIKHAEIAKERAWCDGPPHCYKKALDEAERMLAELA